MNITECQYYENKTTITPCGDEIVIGCKNCPNFEVHDQLSCAYTCDAVNYWRCGYKVVGDCHFDVRDPCGGRECDACEIGGCNHGVIEL